MPIEDADVQLPSEVPNSGQLVDYSKITRADETEVIRPRHNISDPEQADLHARVSDDEIDSAVAALATRPTPDQTVLLHMILLEQQKTNFLLSALLNITNAQEEEDNSQESDV